MRQLGRASARGVAIAGNGWKASEAFSVAAIKQRSAENLREMRLKAAIRRLGYAKEGR